ncbi:S8 family peptidase [Streptomyces hainanensis]|uniref:S8 family peptidase n=1 Tax=Streptomyces hainanensis TaxID=402648 RepID=A0A4R4T6I6_9ACTN|nr:S8 family peptidase [Streptomyces hainanensis]
MAVTRTPRRSRLGGTVATAALLALGIGAALPATAQADEPVGVIDNLGADGTIQDSYIVVLEDGGFSATSDGADRLAERHDAEVTDVYRHALNGFAAEMSEQDALELAAEPGVKEVVQNQRIELADTQTNPPSWGLDRIDQADLPLDAGYTYANEGAGVTAYIIDTGVRLTHQEFEGRARFGYDYWNNGAVDGHGHGTHVAGTVAGASYGVAKEAEIVAVRVLDNSGGGTTASVVGGIDWVTGDADGPSVANMSLGGGVDTVLDAAVRNSVASGVTYAVAAGNNYGADASTRSPARVSEAITVGSTTSADARSDFSNVGSVVDIFAPGTGIASSWATSDTATNTISGTSMATPHVAGAAALYLADNPAATPAEVSDALVNNAIWNRLSGIPGNTVNALLHVGDEGSGPPAPPSGPRFGNSTQVPINDNSTSTSTIAVTGVGTLTGAFQVEVHIVHTYIGDLVVDAIGPDGTVRNLHNRSGGSTDNLDGVFTFNGAGVAADGTWTLRISDNAGADVGYLSSWALQF